MSYRYDKRRRSKRLWWIVGTILAIGFIGLSFILYKNKHVVDAKPVVTVAPKKVEAAKPQNIAGRYLFTGTTYWARAIETEAKGNFAQPFSKLSTFHREQYDAWQTDLECPITNNNVPYSQQVSLLVFNCKPDFLPEASKYFNLINLANNHTDNQKGMAGLSETRTRLSAVKGMQYFGNFDPGVAKDVCEVVGLPIRIQEEGKPDVKGNLPVAFCAWHYVFRLPKPGEIDVMKRYAETMPVFAFMHMGREYIPKAESTQESVAHQIIDSGAEFLIGNQSHWVQNSEVYNGHLIVYSTGNFIFDQLDKETNRGDNISLKISAKDDTNLKRWLLLGKDCLAYQDTCLERAELQKLQKVNLDMSFSVVASQGGYKLLTHRADVATQKAVEQRLNWAETCNSLAEPYSCETNSGL